MQDKEVEKKVKGKIPGYDSALRSQLAKKNKLKSPWRFGYDQRLKQKKS